ncbi:MAG: branched-chain amino acid ABC transporter permease [Lautropia sp.]
MLEFVIRGLLNGSVYALLAVPMSLLFATAATVDFAIGAYALLAAAVASTVAGTLGLAAGLAAAFVASAAMALVFAGLRRKGADHLVISLASFGVSVALSSIVLIVWGTNPFAKPTGAAILEVAGIRINSQSILNAAISITLIFMLYLLLLRTQLGRMMRAAATNPMGAELCGIPVLWVQCATILVGGILGGCAGLFILLGAGLDYSASLGLTLLGFTAAILFGIQNPVRSLYGGLAMGVIEAVAAGYTSGLLTLLLPSLFMLLVLVCSQRGLGLTGLRP